ncbi:MAG: tryptophan-rich sensory protein [Anaerolineae bacterium]|nr:tryptophan-rich sensory protein [Anaerolineae bacterium]
MSNINLDDISPEMRQAALSHLRSSIGEDKYRELISQYGEEGALKLLLDVAATQKESSTSSKPRSSSTNIGWTLLMYALMGGASGLLANVSGGEPVIGAIYGLIGLYFGRQFLGAASSTKSSSMLIGALGILFAAICAVAGIIFLFIPSLGWHYTALAFLIAIPVFLQCMFLVAESTYQCENCGSKDTKIVETYVGSGGYADKAKATYRQCNQCGHAQRPF